jgi:tetratricopeptide (TPR) repeat protein
MKIYYAMAIIKGNMDARHSLDHYYQTDGNEEIIVKRYITGAEKGDTDDMCSLGSYYERKGNIIEMTKYFTMAIERGSIYAMYLMGSHYETENDYNNMKKYYLMAIEKGHTGAMLFLGYYEERKLPGSGLQYFMLGVEKGDASCMIQVADYYKDRGNFDEIEKYYMMAVESGNAYDNDIFTIIAHYESKKNYECVIKCCLIGMDIHKRRAVHYAIKRYLTHEHISTVIKYLIEYNMNIRPLVDYGMTVDDIYIKLYDATKENIMLKNEILELQLRPPELGGPLYEEAKKDFNALLCH